MPNVTGPGSRLGRRAEELYEETQAVAQLSNPLLAWALLRAAGSRLNDSYSNSLSSDPQQSREPAQRGGALPPVPACAEKKRPAKCRSLSLGRVSRFVSPTVLAFPTEFIDGVGCLATAPLPA
jgi:hypothetical protein